MLNVKKVNKPNVAVVCTTHEEVYKLREAAHKAGLEWCTGGSYIDRSVGGLRDSYEYIGHCFYEGRWSHSSIKEDLWYYSTGYKVYTFKEVMVTETKVGGTLVKD